jgi:hypothetical protein
MALKWYARNLSNCRLSAGPDVYDVAADGRLVPDATPAGEIVLRQIPAEYVQRDVPEVHAVEVVPVAVVPAGVKVLETVDVVADKSHKTIDKPAKPAKAKG